MSLPLQTQNLPFPEIHPTTDATHQTYFTNSGLLNGFANFHYPFSTVGRLNWFPDTFWSQVNIYILIERLTDGVANIFTKDNTFISISSRFCSTASRWATESESTTRVGGNIGDDVSDGGVTSTWNAGDLLWRSEKQHQLLQQSMFSSCNVTMLIYFKRCFYNKKGLVIFRPTPYCYCLNPNLWPWRLETQKPCHF